MHDCTNIPPGLSDNCRDDIAGYDTPFSGIIQYASHDGPILCIGVSRNIYNLASGPNCISNRLDRCDHIHEYDIAGCIYKLGDCMLEVNIRTIHIINQYGFMIFGGGLDEIRYPRHGRRCLGCDSSIDRQYIRWGGGSFLLEDGYYG